MKYIAALLALLFVVSGAAFAEGSKISVGVSVGAYTPISSSTRDAYESTMTRVAFTTFDGEKPDHWRFIGELGGFSLDGTINNVQLTPITAGVEKGLNKSPIFQPYIAFRGGPYIGKVEQISTRTTDRHYGLSANAACGAVIGRRLYAEVRYDYFSKLAGYDFSGLSVSAGVKLFDVKF